MDQFRINTIKPGNCREVVHIVKYFAIVAQFALKIILIPAHVEYHAHTIIYFIQNVSPNGLKGIR